MDNTARRTVLLVPSFSDSFRVGMDRVQFSLRCGNVVCGRVGSPQTQAAVPRRGKRLMAELRSQ